MLDSFRPNYQHVTSYTLTEPSSDTTCASQITFQHDGTLSIQVTPNGVSSRNSINYDRL